VWTIFDLEAAEAVNKVALSQGRRQPVLLRIAGHDLFPGQEGGFTLETILPAAERVARMSGLQLTGVTCYPCFTWDDVREKYSPNSNLDSVLLAAKQLRAAGYEITQINAPGNTSLSLLPLLAQYGVTHAEPGHALTGTTPEQGVGKSEEEPAVVYVSEVSMILSSGKAQMYGGGLYARGHARSALVGSSVEELVSREPIPVAFPPAQYIDYQCLLDAPAVNTHVHTGDTVILSFRFQLFVLRSYRAIVEQNARGDWELITVQPESNH
jgi:predicted amino acid racemase